MAVDIDGLSFDSNQFLWEFIAGMYLYQKLDGGNNRSEEYLILPHHSGKEFKFDMTHISFSEWQLKRVINSYRHFGYNNKKSNYITM